MIMDNRLMVARRKYDPDATRYINAVQLADGQALEPEIAMAVDAFVRGCKADSAGYAGDPTRTLWDALKASCILCGARTISGALVPLAGTAPTAYSLASGDYDRSSGLKGDGATKYLTAGIGYNEIATSDEHLSVYSSTAAGDPQNLIGGGTVSPASYSRIGFFSGQQRYDMQTGAAGGAIIAEPSPTGFVGASRSNASSFAYRYDGATAGISRAAATRSTTATEYGVFCANYSDIPISAPTDARLSFYSIGSALDLAALDTRVSTLVAAIAAAL